MWATGISRYTGTCKRCGQSYPIGTMVRFGGTGKKYHTYHLKAECAKSSVSTERTPQENQQCQSTTSLSASTC